MSIPPTRTLPIVLRHLTRPGDPVRLIIATATGTATPTTHVSVDIQGETLVIPKLSGVTVTAGDPVYVLATNTFMLAIGTVT